jgi:putative oxidoreductase
MVHFPKNLAMAGGFLLLFAIGAGAWSVDERAGRASGRT